ncbi:MAG: GNAT family N-acetyltransferase [Planctomycetota bacterium]
MTRSIDAAATAGPEPDDPLGSGPTGDAAQRPVRVPESLRRVAASRLYQGPKNKRLSAADKLLAAAGAHGIDPQLMWATLGHPKDPEPVRQMVMGVPGSGRTAMLFLSPPGGSGPLGTAATQQHELALCVQAACDGLASAGLDIRLIQALPEPHETWGVRACTEGGMTLVGELAYMRRAFTADDRRGQTLEDWPARVEVRPISTAGGPPDTDALTRALDATYIDTLDCPELCGLRRTEDVIASHLSTGVFDPQTWWIIYDDGKPEGCVLMSHCPDHDSVELVYLGLSPKLRGHGLGGRLLRAAMGRCARYGASSVTCAVDRRNTPAASLYERLGFRPFASRVALVRGRV